MNEGPRLAVHFGRENERGARSWPFLLAAKMNEVLPLAVHFGRENERGICGRYAWGPK